MLHGLKIALKTETAKFYSEKQDHRLLTTEVLKIVDTLFYLVMGIV